jgi:hypothetical protein
MFGWKGIGIVTEDQHKPDDAVWYRREGDPDDWLHNKCCACRHEVAKIRETQQ